MSYQGLQADLVSFKGHNGDSGEAYCARPTKPGKVPGVVVIMHLPGWDEWIIEVTRKFAHHGYAAISPNLYFRNGPGSPDDLGLVGGVGPSHHTTPQGRDVVAPLGAPWAPPRRAPEATRRRTRDPSTSPVAVTWIPTRL